MAAQPRPFNSNPPFLPNGTPTGVSAPGATPLLPNQGRIVQSGNSRILCVADVRGNLTSLNDLAKSARADYIIHTGDFGFYDDRSLDRIAEKTLKHVVQYSPLITEETRRQVVNAPPQTSIKDRIPRHQLPLSQLPYFLNNQLRFDVPVYTVWGACEDIQVLEKLRSTEYKIDKLHILDEAHSRLLEVGGVKLRLLGLGGAVVMHKLFDNGEGRTTIAGGQGTMWTTLLQMGELVDTANRTYDPSETRILVTHASPTREGLLNQLSVTLKVDFSISAGLHFRYGSSYNEFSVNPTLDHYRGKLAASKASFQDVWETVKSEVEPAVAENEAQQKLLHNAIDIVDKMPSVANGSNPFGGHAGPSTGQIDEMAFKNMWNFNLADAAFGYLVLEVEGGRIGTEMKAQGFNFAHRGMKNPVLQADLIKSSAASPGVGTPVSANAPPLVAPSAQTAAQGPLTGPPAAHLAQQSFQQARAVQQPRAQPASSTQQMQTAQPSVSKAPATTSSRPAASPAQPVPSQGAKSSTPQPAGTTPTNGTAATADTKPNGVASPAPAGEATTVERKPSSGLYVTSVGSEEEARNLFSAEDQAKIQRVNKMGNFGTAWAVHFSSPEEMQAVLKAVPLELKKSPPGKPNVKELRESRRYEGAGTWGTGSRGGPGQQAGYKSGGASDSEGGRGGRGGFRGRGGQRGSDRGDRARGGRGGGRGRGGQGEGAAAGSASPAPATPTPATGS